MNITSLQNEKVKSWVRLKEKKERDEKNLFLIEGEHLVSEAFKKGSVLEIITTVDSSYDVPTYIVTEEIMKKISEQKSIPSIIAVCQKLEEKEINGSVLLLDGIQDPGNLGTMIRSAVAFNISNIVLSDTCVDVYNSKVIRSTEGMLFSINIVRSSLEKILPSLKKTHLILGTDVVKGSSVKNLNVSQPYCLIIGSEGQGMSELSKSYCDNFLYIQMNPSCESLNAGVSASILMYELESKNGK